MHESERACLQSTPRSKATDGFSHLRGQQNVQLSERVELNRRTNSNSIVALQVQRLTTWPRQREELQSILWKREIYFVLNKELLSLLRIITPRISRNSHRFLPTRPHSSVVDPSCVRGSAAQDLPYLTPGRPLTQRAILWPGVVDPQQSTPATTSEHPLAGAFCCRGG